MEFIFGLDLLNQKVLFWYSNLTKYTRAPMTGSTKCIKSVRRTKRKSTDSKGTPMTGSTKCIKSVRRTKRKSTDSKGALHFLAH